MADEIFISYAEEDREDAERLARALKSQGRSVWWDREIGVGKTFREEILRQLEAAKAVVVLWSRHSVTSEWVRDEAEIARGRGTLFPIRIDLVDPPLGFRQRQAADLIGWEGDESHKGFQSLLKALSEAGVHTEASARPASRVDKPQRRRRVWMLRSALIALAVLLTAGIYSFLPLSRARYSAETPSRPEEHLVSLDFKDAELREVLESCAKQVGAVLALGPGLGGRFAIKVQDTKLSEVMNYICETKSCTWEVKPGTPPALFVNPRSNPPRPEP